MHHLSVTSSLSFSATTIYSHKDTFLINVYGPFTPTVFTDVVRVTDPFVIAGYTHDFDEYKTFQDVFYDESCLVGYDVVSFNDYTLNDGDTQSIAAPSTCADDSITLANAIITFDTDMSESELA